jgi:hypothetical protein
MRDRDPARVPWPQRTVPAELAKAHELKASESSEPICALLMLTMENNMKQKIVLTGLAALMLTASAVPASAQARRGSDIYISSPSDYGGWYGDYAQYGPGIGVSVGVGAPGWADDNWAYGAYAAAPCACGTTYRSARIAPRYRSSGWGSYSNDYAYYPYDDYYYGGTYASVGVGWSDDGWRSRRTWRDGDRFDRSRRDDRVRSSDRSRTTGDSFVAQSRTTVRGGADTRGARSEFRGGVNAEIGGTSGRAGAEFRSGTGSEPNGRGGRRGDNR